MGKQCDWRSRRAESHRHTVGQADRERATPPTHTDPAGHLRAVRGAGWGEDGQRNGARASGCCAAARAAAAGTAALPAVRGAPRCVGGERERERQRERLADRQYSPGARQIKDEEQGERSEPEGYPAGAESGQAEAGGAANRTGLGQEAAGGSGGASAANALDQHRGAAADHLPQRRRRKRPCISGRQSLYCNSSVSAAK